MMRLTQVWLLAQSSRMNERGGHRRRHVDQRQTRHGSRSFPESSVFLLQPVTQSFERRIGRRRFIRICALVLQGEVHHRQQAIKIPAIKIDGSLTRLRFDPSIKSEGLGHVDGEALQFVKFVSGDENRELHVVRPQFHVAYDLSEPRRRGFMGMSPCLAGELLQRVSGVRRPRALNFSERRDHDVSQLPTRPPCPREKHNRFLVGNSRQGLHYLARRPLEQKSFQMPQRFNAAHSSEGAGGCERDFVVRIINH